jgi:N-acetylneuraminic acid mutarotase
MYSEDGINWMPGKDLPMMSAYHKSVVFDDKMWIIGGMTESGPSNQVYYYDKNTSMWMPYEMPMDFRPMYNHSVIVVDKGMREDGIYILGSYDGTNYIRGMWKMY